MIDLADDVSCSESPYSALGREERALLRLAEGLGAEDIGGDLSYPERRLLEGAQATFAISSASLDEVRRAILAGDDPLGDSLSRIRPPVRRRHAGAFYTPSALVQPMVDWALSRKPDRLIDPGCGSGRFAAAAIRRRPDLPVVAIDLDPLATLLTRASLAVLGAKAATVLHADYTALELPRIDGRTAFVGNPPYVRHHGLSSVAKKWAVTAARRLGYDISTLAGLHVYFFLATAMLAQPGDAGCFVTSAEWLDVNYGAVVRRLFLDGLGGEALHMVDPRAVAFEDAMTTAVIACFTVGSRSESIRLRVVAGPEELSGLSGGDEVARVALGESPRWTPLLYERGHDSPLADLMPLRQIARVHRGLVTGANNFFVLSRARAHALGVESWCRPAVTGAEEVLRSKGVVRDSAERRLLLDVPPDVDRSAHPQLDAYLRLGEEPQDGELPIAQRYIPRHRRPWWYLGRTDPPPIVASYMARQAPVFALNPDGLAVINIAHGIYPTETLTPQQLADLVAALNAARDSFRGHGRTYHGGLEKYEPREMEALPIPVAGHRP